MGFALDGIIFLVELQAFFPVEDLTELVAAGETLIEGIVAETDVLGVVDVATIIDLVDIGPKDGPKAHRARLARGVDLAAA